MRKFAWMTLLLGELVSVGCTPGVQQGGPDLVATADLAPVMDLAAADLLPARDLSTPDMAQIADLRLTCSSDDFNRPDGPSVGAGWEQLEHYTGKDSCGVRTCMNVTSLGSGRVQVGKSGSSGYGCDCPYKAHIARPLGMALPLTLSTDYLPNADLRIAANLALSSDTKGSDMVTVEIRRSSRSTDNSEMALYRGGAHLSDSPSIGILVAQGKLSFQFSAAEPIRLTLTVGADGAMLATVRQGTNSFSLSSAPGPLPASLNYVILWDQSRMSYDSFNVDQTAFFDNFTVCPG